MRFDPGKILLDPYGRGVVVPGNYSREAARLKGDNVATALKNVVVDTTGYDWAGDTRLHRPASRTIIYEMHIRGFTRNPNSGVSEPNRKQKHNETNGENNRDGAAPAVTRRTYLAGPRSVVALFACGDSKEIRNGLLVAKASDVKR